MAFVKPSEKTQACDHDATKHPGRERLPPSSRMFAVWLIKTIRDDIVIFIENIDAFDRTRTAETGYATIWD